MNYIDQSETYNSPQFHVFGVHVLSCNRPFNVKKKKMWFGRPNWKKKQMQRLTNIFLCFVAGDDSDILHTCNSSHSRWALRGCKSKLVDKMRITYIYRIRHNRTSANAKCMYFFFVWYVCQSQSRHHYNYYIYLLHYGLEAMMAATATITTIKPLLLWRLFISLSQGQSMGKCYTAQCYAHLIMR